MDRAGSEVDRALRRSVLKNGDAAAKTNIARRSGRSTLRVSSQKSRATQIRATERRSRRCGRRSRCPRRPPECGAGAGNRRRSTSRSLRRADNERPSFGSADTGHFGLVRSGLKLGGHIRIPDRSAWPGYREILYPAGRPVPIVLDSLFAIGYTLSRHHAAGFAHTATVRSSARRPRLSAVIDSAEPHCRSWRALIQCLCIGRVP